jgi:hypothetical protein
MKHTTTNKPSLEGFMMLFKLMCLELQDILEKFEFFPIKCRIQRALEIFKMSRDGEANKSSIATRMKMKVWLPALHFNY